MFALVLKNTHRFFLEQRGKYFRLFLTALLAQTCGFDSFYSVENVFHRRTRPDG